MRAAARLGSSLALGLGLGLGGACFSAPQPAVQFSCDLASAPECPEGYTCEADGCCHRDGSDYDAHAGQCQLGGGLLTAGSGSTGDSSGSESSSSGGSSSGGSSSGATSSDSGSSSEGGSSSGAAEG